MPYTYGNMDEMMTPLVKKLKDDNLELSIEIERLKLEISIRKEMYDKVIERFKVVLD